MIRSSALLFLLLASCGGGTPDGSTVRRYEDVSGNPVGPDHNLGFTYYIDHSNARHGADGWNHEINEVLFYDNNPLRMRNVVVHELGQRLILKYGEPANIDQDWFTWDGDTKGDAMMSFFEANWFAQYGTYHVSVSDDWLVDATDEAVEFINANAGVEVFTR